MIIDEIKATMTEYAEQICEQLRTAIRSKNVTKYGPVNASGDLADSVRYEVTETHMIVFAADYLIEIEHGRRPGKFPPREAILAWIDNKRLSYDIPIDSLAFLISRKIAKEGTQIWKQGGSGIVEGVITEDLLNEIRDSLTSVIIEDVASDILSMYQLAA